MGFEESQVESIFCAAIQRESAAERAAYLDQACVGDPDLRNRVELLLEAQPKLGRFLENDQADDALRIDHSIVEQPGMTVGRYKLLEEIGEGGMGMVYMAEQREPVRRKVALKIVKPGMDTRQVIGRFEAERQALALMDHPNIAHVFDGGATDSGRPYFVMELVRGIPLTQYCDEAKLTTDERLRLFVSVCDAVQHAHQKGIIHRDIKPTNVLVTLHGETPVPKIIDFGVAKATNQQLTEKTVYTGFGQMIGTPLYMSPEQMSLSGLDVDTRSDIYSLGVLLYELLTGVTPFDKERFRELSYDEVRRTICEEEPPQPSIRISTLAAEAASTISTNRKTQVGSLRHLLRGELDWIVMKAMEKDRTRRYESANEMAKDVQRYLHDEPVEACPPSMIYRLGKLYRRNKLALMTVSAVALALVLGAGLAAWQAIVASQANCLANERLVQADEQRQRAEDNVQLALQALDEVYLKAIGEEKLLRQVDYLPDGDVVLRTQYHFSDLERELLQRGLAFYDQFAQRNHENPHALFATGKAFYRVAILQSKLKTGHEAQHAYVEAISRFRQLAEQNPTKADYFLALGKAYVGQSVLDPSPSTDTLAKAKEALDRAIQLAPTNAAAYRFRSRVHVKLANYHSQIADLRTAVQITPNNSSAHRELASALLWSQDPTLKDIERALRHAEMALELDPANVNALICLAQIQRDAGDFESALVHYGRAAQIATSPDVVDTANRQASQTRADLFRREGRYEEALAAQTKAVQLSVNSESAYYDFVERGEVYLVMRKYDKALADFSKGIELGPDKWHIYKRRAVPHFRLGNYDEALADIAKAVELNPEDTTNLTWIPPSQVAACPDEGFRKGLLEEADKTIESTNGSARAFATRGWLLAAFGQEERALADLKTAFERIPKDDAAGRLGLSETCYELGNLCGELAHREEAIPYLARLAALQPENASLSYQAALAQLGAGQLDSYPDTCHAMLERFQNAKEVNDTYWVAWTCLLAREAVEDYTPVVRLAENAVEADPKSDVYRKTLGGILFRAGRFQEAVQRLTEANNLIEEPDSKSTSSPAYTWYFLAMVHHELGHDEEARTWLVKANEWTEKVLAEREEGTTTVPWNRKLTLKLFREEAEGMIGNGEG